MHPAVSSSLSYGLVVHLLLLSTTHRCVAVAFGYRPESVYLERTLTSLTTRAFRRTCRTLRALGFLLSPSWVPLRSTPGRGPRPSSSAGVRDFMLPPAARVLEK
jgi:hypothetical protein